MIEILKVILGKKLGAKRLRSMMRTMELMPLEDLNMEVEEVEAKAIEMMETEEISALPEDIEMRITEDPLSNPEEDREGGLRDGGW